MSRKRGSFKRGVPWNPLTSTPAAYTVSTMIDTAMTDSNRTILLLYCHTPRLSQKSIPEENEARTPFFNNLILSPVLILKRDQA